MERATMAISGSVGAVSGGSHDRRSGSDSRSSANTSTNESHNNPHQGPGGVAQSFMAVLSAKLTNSMTLGSSSCSGNESSAGNSPRPTRKHSVDHHQQQQHHHQYQQQQQQQQLLHQQMQLQLQQQQQQQHQQQQQLNRNSKTSSEFLETLNARLAQQQRVTGQNNSSMRSASVRRIMANRVPIIDPLQVRDSLMDQIRRGTSLRKTAGPINDRSAPKIY